MSFNIIDMVKGQISDQLVGQIGGLLGESPDKAKNAIDSAVPTLLAGIGESAQDPNGADTLLNLVNRQDDSVVDGIGSMIGSNQSSELIESGTRGLGSMLGSNGVSSMINGLSGHTGLGKGSAGSMLGMLTPMIFGQLKRKASADGLNASGLASMLKGQGSNISAAMPSGMMKHLETAGFGESRHISGSGGGFSGGKVAAGAAAATAGVAGVAATAGRGVGNAASSAAGAAGNVASSARDTASGAVRGVSNTASGAAGAAASAGRGVSNAAGGAVDAAKGAAGSVSRGVSNTAGGAVDAAKGAAGSVSHGVSNTAGGAVDAAKGAAGSVGRGVSNTAGGAVDAAKGAAGSVGRGVGNAADAAGNAAGNAGRAVSGAASGAAGATRNAAGSVGRGVDAAGNKVGGAVDSTRNAARSATDTTRTTTQSTTRDTSVGTTSTHHEAPRKKGGIWKWLLPIALAVLAWFGFKQLGNKEAMVDPGAAVSETAGDIGGQIGDFFGSTTETLSGVTDAESATAALPALETAQESLGGLTGLLDGAGDSGKAAASDAIKSGMDGLGPVVEKLQGDSGIWGVLEPVVGPMMETLKGLGG